MGGDEALDPPATAGDWVYITYGPGFSEGDFAYDDTYMEEPIPVIMHIHQLEHLNLRIGDVGYISNVLQRHGRASFPVRVIGSYRGTVQLEAPGGKLHGAMLMPLEALSSVRGTTMRYTTTLFFMEPLRYRELDQFREFVRIELRQYSWAGITLLMGFPFDGDLRLAVEPLEQNLYFLRILHPIVLGLSLAIGAGLALLIMMQSAKNAAIMRALGFKKQKVRATLCAELAAVALAGVVLGILVMSPINMGFPASLLMTASLYFGSVIIGSTIGAILISRRPPMELLQVKE